MKPPKIKKFHQLLTPIDATIQINSQAYDRKFKRQKKDLCDTEPLSTREMTEEQLQKLILFMQRYQQEQDKQEPPRRKTGFRLSITIRDIYSDTILDHLEAGFNQLFPVYQFLLSAVDWKTIFRRKGRFFVFSTTKKHEIVYLFQFLGDVVK